MEYTDVILRVIAIYSLFTMIFGTIGNSLSVVVCLRPQLRTTPTFIFYSFLLASDTLSLFWWNMDHYLLAYENYQMEEMNLHACRAVTFFQMFSYQWSTWLLVCMTIERYLSVSIKTWRNSMFKPKNAVIICVLTGLVFGLMNLYFAISVNYDDSLNNTTIDCFGDANYAIWMQQNNYVFCFIPFTIMIFTNILLLIKLNSSSKIKATTDTGKGNRKKSTSITVLVITTTFIIMIAPEAIANAFFVPMLFETPLGIVILFLCDCVAFTFHSFNCVALYVSNKQYQREVKRFLKQFSGNNKIEPTHTGGAGTTMAGNNTTNVTNRAGQTKTNI